MRLRAALRRRRPPCAALERAGHDSAEYGQRQAERGKHRAESCVHRYASHAARAGHRETRQSRDERPRMPARALRAKYSTMPSRRSRKTGLRMEIVGADPGDDRVGAEEPRARLAGKSAAVNPTSRRPRRDRGADPRRARARVRAVLRRRSCPPLPRAARRDRTQAESAGIRDANPRRSRRRPQPERPTIPVVNATVRFVCHRDAAATNTDAQDLAEERAAVSPSPRNGGCTHCVRTRSQ